MFIATPTGICTYLHNVDTKRGDWRGLSAAFDKPVYGEGKVLPVTARPNNVLTNNIHTKPGG